MQAEAPTTNHVEGIPFEDRFVDALNNGALMISCSIGHRVGLFDTMADVDWADSEQIAARAGLNERYVREWLGAVTTGGIVETDGSGRFRLPAEHAGLLTRRSESNLAVFSQYISLFGQVEDAVLDCFRNGGGVSYESYPRFHEVMAEDSGISVLPALESAILPLVPGLIERLERGIDMLDVGCGRGRALLQLAERFPASTFIGIDISEEATSWARREAARRGLGNVRFDVRDATDFDQTAEPNRFDLVTTFDAIHDQARPLAVLRGIARTLKSDGVYIMQEIHASSHVHHDLDHPLGPLLYTVSCMHCTPVSLAQGGEGLGAMWGRERAREMLRAAGFENVEMHRLEHDIQNDYYVVRHR
jgi:ubiquinone/menaquinone biosynthesis C-methylase UbiE